MVDQAGKVIVLISADSEWQAVEAYFEDTNHQLSPFGDWFHVRIDALLEKLNNDSHLYQAAAKGGEAPESVIFFHGGWGKIAAAASTQYVIDRWQPELLINLGTCGGFEGHVEQGDVILANNTIVYDIIELMGDMDEHIAHYSTELETDWLSEATLPFAVRKTLLVSGDRDLQVSDIPGLNQLYGAVAGDWESGAIAWVAKRNQTRLIILRGVSDVVRSVGSEAYGNLDYFLASAGKIMAQLVRALPVCIAQAYAASD